MKTLGGFVLGYLLYSAAVFAHGCATTSGQKVQDCATIVASQAGANLAPTVAAILDSNEYEAALIGLAAQLGADFVNCLVQQFVPSVHTAQITPRAAHAVEWLKVHGRSQ